MAVAFQSDTETGTSLLSSDGAGGRKGVRPYLGDPEIGRENIESR